MDKFPLMQGCFSVGELITEQEALYTWFEARCRLPGEGLWCAWAVGDRGELRLGVLEPVNGKLTIRRRFSRRMTEPLGKLVQGELRPAAGEGTWEPLGNPSAYFHSAYIQNQLRGVEGVRTRQEGSCRYVAIPYETVSNDGDVLLCPGGRCGGAALHRLCPEPGGMARGFCTGVCAVKIRKNSNYGYHILRCCAIMSILVGKTACEDQNRTRTGIWMPVKNGRSPHEMPILRIQ